MSRIEPRQGVLANLMARGSKAVYGRELSASRIYAHHPRLSFDFMRYNRAAERGRRVPKALTELAVLKAATMVGCEFCIDIGSEYARRAGLSDAQLLALHEAHDSGLFSEDELLVIDLVVGMTRTPSAVSEKLMTQVNERFGAKGALELIHMIAWENGRARINIALDIGGEGFSEGKVCALADRDFAAVAAQP